MASTSTRSRPASRARDIASGKGMTPTFSPLAPMRRTSLVRIRSLIRSSRRMSQPLFIKVCATISAILAHVFCLINDTDASLSPGVARADSFVGHVAVAAQHGECRILHEPRVGLRQAAEVEPAPACAFDDARVLATIAEAKRRPRFYVRRFTSSDMRLTISSTGLALRSSPLRRRTAASCASASRSPTTSM